MKTPDQFRIHEQTPASRTVIGLALAAALAGCAAKASSYDLESTLDSPNHSYIVTNLIGENEPVQLEDGTRVIPVCIDAWNARIRLLDGPYAGKATNDIPQTYYDDPATHDYYDLYDLLEVCDPSEL